MANEFEILINEHYFKKKDKITEEKFSTFN